MANTEYGAVKQTTLTSIANAIRTKTGKTGTIKPSEFADDISNIIPFDSFLDGSLKTFSSNVTSVPASAFANSPSLEEVSLSNISEVPALCFYQCSKLKNVLLPNITSVRGSGFSNCTQLISISFPSVTEVEQNAFYNCFNLEEISLPNVTTIQGDAFYSCQKLSNVVLPNIEVLFESVFAHCTNLLSLDLGTSTMEDTASINNLCFSRCSKLATLILRYTEYPVNIVSTGVFSNTPFASGGTGGTVYVPSALIADYQSDRIWSTILGYPNNQILPIEGSPYENQ